MKLIKPNDVNVKIIHIRSNGHRVPLLIVSPIDKKPDSPGILWIHGGGYFLGMKEMVYMSRAIDLVRKYNAVVVSPGYRLAFQAPYPAALTDCYHALIYMKKHAYELGIRSDQLMIGGESAGGGLCAAVCMVARDKGTVNVAYQMPLYPMLDNHDTVSSENNHGKIWNTRRNHFGWKIYLRENAGKNVSPYASPSRQNQYKGLPPAYTFVGNGEPFYEETLQYIHNLQEANIEASVDIYESDIHAFDLLKPDCEISKEAIRNFEMHFEYALIHYFAPQDNSACCSDK